MRITAGKGKLIGVALAVVAAIAATGLVLLVSPPGLEAKAVGAACGPHANHHPDEATSRQLRKALACLINRERAERDRRKLRRSDALTGIARRHTKVMIKQECFKHQCPGERPLRKRIEASDYIKGGRYGYGENLGCSETPAGMVAVWMESAFHRKNIVDGRFRHFGIGAKNGSPFPRGSDQCRPGRDYMTYTVLFGWRKPK